MRSLVFVVALVLAIGAACSTSQAIDTGIGVATAVTEAVGNRAIFGECYAMCGEGTRCNRETGFCEREGKPASPAAATPDLTLEDRCRMVLRDMIADRERGLGDEHPAMVGYRTRLARCDQLLASRDPAARACGAYELELVALESDGLGAKHPDVVAQRALLDKCRADVAAQR